MTHARCPRGHVHGQSTEGGAFHAPGFRSGLLRQVVFVERDQPTGVCGLGEVLQGVRAREDADIQGRASLAQRREECFGTLRNAEAPGRTVALIEESHQDVVCGGQGRQNLVEVTGGEGRFSVAQDLHLGMGPFHPGSQGLALVADDQQRLAALQLRRVDLPEPGEHVAPDALLEGGQVNRPQLRGGLPLFGEQDFQARRIDPGGVQSSGAQGGHDTVDDEGGGRGEQQHVVARIQRRHFARSRRHRFSYSGHGQGVGEDQAFKSEGVEKQVTDDGWGQGGRPSRDGIQCRNVQVGRHDAFHPAGDQVAEGRELDSV